FNETGPVARGRGAIAVVLRPPGETWIILGSISPDSGRRGMSYIIGIDTGGTFTDCVVMDADGHITTAKASSTPGDFSEGVMESLRLAAERLGLTAEALLGETARLALGTTVGTNAMLERRGARVGLITTRGHRDVIHIMRGARGVPGLNNVQV